MLREKPKFLFYQPKIKMIVYTVDLSGFFILSRCDKLEFGSVYFVGLLDDSVFC
jgi:hypothetical protein